LRCGLLSGDEVVSVNGTEMSRLTHSEAVAVFKATKLTGQALVLIRRRTTSQVTSDNNSRLVCHNDTPEPRSVTTFSDFSSYNYPYRFWERNVVPLWQIKQESHAVARKPSDARVIFFTKYWAIFPSLNSDITVVFTTLISYKSADTLAIWSTVCLGIVYLTSNCHPKSFKVVNLADKWKRICNFV